MYSSLYFVIASSRHPPARVEQARGIVPFRLADTQHLLCQSSAEFGDYCCSNQQANICPYFSQTALLLKDRAQTGCKPVSVLPYANARESKGLVPWAPMFGRKLPRSTNFLAGSAQTASEFPRITHPRRTPGGREALPSKWAAAGIMKPQ
jgi:hypothetical protein